MSFWRQVATTDRIRSTIHSTCIRRDHGVVAGSGLATYRLNIGDSTGIRSIL